MNDLSSGDDLDDFKEYIASPTNEKTKDRN